MKNGKTTASLFDKEMQRPSFRKAFREEKKRFGLELQITQLLKDGGWTYESFAKRIGTAKSHVSRDLRGGLHHATVARIEKMAKALHMLYYPLLIPESKAKRLIPQIVNLVNT